MYATDSFASIDVIFFSNWMTHFDINVSPYYTRVLKLNQVRVS